MVASVQQPVAPFYEAAGLALRAVSARSRDARRFGPDADARWKLLVGSPPRLSAVDRARLTLRDAALAYPGAFAPRVVFALTGLPADEPVGRAFPDPDPATAQRWFVDPVDPIPTDPDAALAAVAAAWSLVTTPPDAASQAALADLAPATRVLARGAGAVLALARALRGRPGFDLADQVTLATDHPGERMLLGVAAALHGSAAAPRLVPAATFDAARATVDRVVASPPSPRPPSTAPAS